MIRRLLLAVVLLCGLPRLAWAAPPATCASGQGYYDYSAGAVTFYICTAANTWTSVSANAMLPAGSIVLTLTSCPTGFTESAALNGKMLRGTVAANGDVGLGGGADAITPAGTVSTPTFSGNSVTSSAVSAGTPAGTNGSVAITPLLNAVSWPVGVPTFAGSSGTVPAQTFTGSSATSSAVSAGTPAGTNSTSTVATVTASKAGTSAGAFSTIGGAAPGSSFTVPAQTFTGSALGTHTHTLTATGTNGTVSFTPTGTVAWPAGVPTVTGASTTVGAQTFTGSALGTHTHTTTATGSVSTPTFTGTGFDNRPAYVNVIFCQKT